MVWVGIDAHKKVLVAVAVDDAGQEVSSWRAHNRTSDWQDCSDWIKGIRGVSAVGIEGAYSYGRGLAQWLVGQTFIVYDVNPRWTAGYRKTARRQHKTDPLDARAVASVVRRDAPDLPQVHADDVSSLLQVMVSERDAAQSESVRLRNQLHDHFFQLGVELKALDATKLRKVLAQLASPGLPRSIPSDWWRSSASPRVASSPSLMYPATPPRSKPSRKSISLRSSRSMALGCSPLELSPVTSVRRGALSPKDRSLPTQEWRRLRSLRPAKTATASTAPAAAS